MQLTIERDGVTTTIAAEAGKTIAVLLKEADKLLDVPCGGRGSCGKCKVFASGALSPLSEQERQRLTQAEQDAGVRLACQTTVQGDAWVRCQADAPTRILTDGQMPKFPLRPWAKGYGVAIDVGTTTLAAYLLRLSDGEQVAVASLQNPQTAFGADVITRMGAAANGQGAALKAAVVGGVNTLVDTLAQRSGVSPEQVAALVVTGNTAMLYLLCGYDPTALLTVPFRQDHYFGKAFCPTALGVKLPNAVGCFPRCISSYIGADLTTAALIASLHTADESAPTRVLMDIGTNGEMLLSYRGKTFGCSTAAGPTFEGAGVTMGMAAKNGAIAHVRLVDGQFVLETIGGGKPVGVCGSGVIDAVAALLEAEIIDETGRLYETGHDYPQCMAPYAGRIAFRFPNTDVYFTQADVRAVQLAKAAIAAGLIAMLHRAKCPMDAVDSLLLAGGFGNVIDVPAAVRIGLLPKALQNRTRGVGNAAGMGAVALLQDGTLKDASASFAKHVVTVELATDPCFVQAFTDQMLFPESDELN